MLARYLVRHLWLTAVLLGTPWLGWAAPSPATFTAQVTPAVARPGETVTVTVAATIAAPYHVYSIQPVPQPGPQETVVTVEAGPLAPGGKTQESAPKRQNDPNFGKEVAYHESTATFTHRSQVKPSAAPATRVPVKVTVRFMACTDKICLPPRDVDVAAALAIEAGPVRAEYAASAAAIPPGSDTAFPSGNQNNPGQAESLLLFVMTAFGAGLLALITPCVFPMIPVTLAFFTKQATASGEGANTQRTVVRLAATYSLGIVVAFTAIGAVLAATIGATGANQLAAHPWVNLAFAVLFVLFGLALLEVVELRLPSGIQNLTMRGHKHGGTLGVLGMGLTFVIAAFTCTAPFVGTILVAAANASSGAQWVRPVLGMAAFAAALALPFFVLALFPGWLARLPRSGAWLSTVKGTMGFLEIAAALKFLSNADMVQGWNLLPRPLLLALWGLIGLAGAVWLLGALRVGLSAPEGRTTFARGLWAVVFAAAGVYCLYGVGGRPLAGALVAFLPPADYGVAGGQAAAAAHNGLTWLKTLDEGLAQAKAENKPVFVDFTGYTCTNCRWMENNVFPASSVRQELDQFVRVQLYTDGRDVQSKQNQAYQEKTFGDVALPLYAILGPDGAPGPRSAGITRDPNVFARFLREGREKEAATRGATSTASARVGQ